MNPLTTVDSLHSGSRSNPSRGSNSVATGGGGSVVGAMPLGGGGPPPSSSQSKGLKRSPYLSTMTATKESMDLVEALSRPAAKPG
eukprot:CAMPEP_0171413182 /NCGR_PEP_ID=MMETSP0880-20121228/34459_1 /TAXON_ID=67004 /ORGANISM="Thalassiosira weissflogii, Strain CCMP1336" /LENGTH=84 /DNA_ID=CAMNT_0011930815 /DNA_START=12 /DNA_END=262 /DNA_ORIENTATION=-